MKIQNDVTYKGTRILFKEQAKSKRILINQMIDILTEYGYEEMMIPIIQKNETFLKKVGTENQNMMYTFKDRGDRDLCLAPEYCQTKDTLISTDNGFLYLDEIGNINGDKTQNIDINLYNDIKGMIDKSTSFYIQGEKPTKHILLNSGITLKCTYNHKYKVLRGNKYEFIQASDLQVGDNIAYSCGEYKGGEYQILTHNYIKKKNNTSKQVINVPTILDEDLAWFLGLYYADGCNLDRGFHIYGNKLIKRGFDRLVNILKKYNVSYRYYENKKNNKCYISINCVELISFFKENNVLKFKSFDILFPLLVRKSPKSVIKSFIDGYLTGDGFTSKYGNKFATSVSKKFIQELTIINRALGVDSKFSIIKKQKDSFGNRIKYRYNSRAGRLTTKNNRNKLFKILNNLGYDNILVDTIVSITNSVDSVYEISVPNKETYIANSYISHNTAVVQLLAIAEFKYTKDVKLFYIGECFRGEKPQNGRYREFTQFGVEVLNPSKDYMDELITIASRLISLKTDKFEISTDVTRGLDYYVGGKGFEITCPELGAQKQVVGGGSYDGGLGFAIGVDRLILV